MRVFEPVEQFEWHHKGHLMGVYLPGLRYTCREDGSDDALSGVLDTWVAEGRVKVIEEISGTGPAQLGGTGEVN